MLLGSTPVTVDIINSTRDEADAEKDVNELYSIILQCKGGTYPEQQVNISKLRKMRSAMIDMDVQLNKEPDNAADRNALAFYVVIDGIMKRIGYVGVQDIPRMKLAIDNDEIFSIKISSCKAVYRKAVKKSLFELFCAVTKKGKWPESDASNYYNKIL